MKSIEITHQHIAALKEHRFFAYRPANFLSYEENQESVGWIKVGSKLNFRASVELEPYSAIYGGRYRGGKGAGESSGLCTMGTMSYSHSALPDRMKVGRYCSIGEGLKVLDSHHPTDRLSTSHFSWRTTAPMVQAVCQDRGIDMATPPAFHINGPKPFPVIKNDVWIGQHVTLSMGISIGNGAVVAANSVVTKSVPDFAIVGGNPAKVIKYRFTEYQREELTKIQWWNYLFSDFHTLDSSNVFNFLQQWRGNDYVPYTPKVLTLPDDFMAV